MTSEEFNEMLLAPNCTECEGLTADSHGEWRCVYQGKRATEDCYGTDYCCMLYLIQLETNSNDDDDFEEEDEDRDYCDEAAGNCDCCELVEFCDDAYPDEDEDEEANEDLCECKCEECGETTTRKEEEGKPVETEIGG